jgi:hypothetical protein
MKLKNGKQINYLINREYFKIINRLSPSAKPSERRKLKKAIKQSIFLAYFAGRKKGY